MTRYFLLAPAALVLPACVVSQSTYDFLKADYDKLRSQNEASEKKAQELSADLDAEQKRADELNARNAALQQDLEQTSERLRQRTAELEERAAAERQASADRVRQLEAEIQKAKLAGSEQVTAMEAELARVQAQAQESEQKSQQELAKVKEQAELASRKLNELTETYDGLVQNLKTEISEQQVQIRQSLGRIQIDLFDQILFDSGSADLNSKGQGVLKKVAAILKKTKDRRVLVEGHTDNQKISGRLTGRFPTNWELSTARAVNVVRFLEAQGVPPKILTAAGASYYRPVADNGTEKGRSRNRRIEISLIPEEVVDTKAVK